jgi:hypothetical protein
VAGFTYYFVNPSTNYRKCIDFHLDWGASQFLSEHWHVGTAGYVFNQISSDSGAGNHVGSFESRVFGAGPQAGYIFSIGDHQAYINLKGYREFGAVNRPSGWNVWLTLWILLAASSN